MTYDPNLPDSAQGALDPGYEYPKGDFDDEEPKDYE